MRKMELFKCDSKSLYKIKIKHNVKKKYKIKKKKKKKMEQKGYWINDLLKTDNVKSYSENKKSLKGNMI